MVKTYLPSRLAKDRTAWGKEQLFCWLCGRAGTETHEIASRAQAPGRWADRTNYARVCSRCHAEFAAKPFAEQLAIKAIHDDENFSLARWIEIRGNGPREVEYTDLFWAAIKIIQERAGATTND